MRVRDVWVLRSESEASLREVDVGGKVQLSAAQPFWTAVALPPDRRFPLA